MRDTEKMTMRQEQAAETRKKLLNAAEKLFAENGYSATPVRRINNSIGMADGLLYHYFPGGKKEILQVMVREKFEKIVFGLRSGVSSLEELSLEEVIETIYQNWAALFAEHQDVIKILFRENEAMQLVEREKLAELVHSGDRWFPEFLRRRAECGEILEIDYVSAAEVLTAVLFNHFLTVLTGVGQGQLSDSEHRKKLIEYQVDLWKKA